ncbi:MAG: TetR/AcrR family transcriptional regulator [Spirochaetota bacterium]
MNRRQRQKEKTREHILAASKKFFIRKGVLASTTEGIAKACGVAQGTLFLHFKTKENLILGIFEKELMRIAEELYILTGNAFELKPLLEAYLSFLEKEEDFLSVIGREFPFFPNKLKRQILSLEAIIRHIFYTTIENGIERGSIKRLDITAVLTFLFGTLNYYLSMKKIFVARGSVISAKKQSIIDTFSQFISV